MGRLVEVDSPGGGADALYEYDALDRLVEVRLTDPAEPPAPSDPPKEQIREFGYDRLGRLRHAVNPENGTTEYTKYDARGNLIEFLDSRLNRFTRAYDAAGRLTAERLKVGSNEHTLVENVYDEASTFGLSAGKLTTARSYRWDGTAAQLVSEKQFVYGTSGATLCFSTQGGDNYEGLNGRLAKMRTRVLPWNELLESSYCYDTQGMTTRITYPNLSGSARPESEVGYLFHNGFLWEAHDTSPNRDRQYISDIAYGPHGSPIQITRGNGVVNRMPVDSRGRPLDIEVLLPIAGTPWPPLEEIPGCDGQGQGLLEIQFCGTNNNPGGVETLWASGTYGYDDAGNIESIGSDAFRYDPLNRLVSASMSHGTATYNLGYSYDAFGNMLQQTKTVAGDPIQNVRDYDVEWQTNRLIGQTHTYGTQDVTSYGYDAAGNMISANDRSYQFDVQGRLGQVTDNANGAVGQYYYDSSGHRVLSVVDGIRTYFVRDDAGRVLSEFRDAVDDADAPEWDKDYVYALGHAIAFSKNDLPARVDTPWADNVSEDGLTLHWEKVLEPDVQQYHVEKVYREALSSDLETEEVYFRGAVDSWTQVFPNQYIKGGTVLYYRVQAIDNAENPGDWSPTFTIRPHQNAGGPPVPQNLSSAPTDRAVRLFWNPVDDDDLWGYMVEMETSPGSGVWQTLNTIPIPVPEFWHTGLVNGQEYSYRVRARDTSGRQSDPSTPTTTTPIDNVPPARPTGLVGRPGREAEVVELSWNPVYDHDLGGYRVRRSGVYVSALDGATAFIDTSNNGINAGTQYCYKVVAIDTTGNESQPSGQVCVRPRHDEILAPQVQEAKFEVDDNLTTSDDGVPGSGHENWCDYWQEDDDVIQVRVKWGPIAGAETYRVYRAPAGSDEFLVIGTVNPGTNCPAGECWYLDKNPDGYRFVYEVTALKTLNGVSEESAIGDNPVDNTVGADLLSLGPVRNLKAYTGDTIGFDTFNAASRAVLLRWSRVPDPRVIGYHVYRRCDLLGGEADGYRHKVQQVEFCADSWQRLTAQPVTAERVFEDRTMGGLQGFYLYAVRPVTADGEEGPIDKILEISLHNQPTFSFSCIADSQTISLSASPAIIDTDVERARVNAAQPGAGSAAGTPAAPPFARVQFRDVPPVVAAPGYRAGIRPTRYVYLWWEYVQWVSGAWQPVDPPNDLAGFHIEVAGSYDGPWRRITTGRMVAWWERAYRYLGVGVRRHNAQTNQYFYFMNDQFSGNLDCLHFRVIAVDEGGNESGPMYPDRESWDGNTQTFLPYSLDGCPQTPAAPQNLRAETESPGTPPSVPCTTRIAWDPVPGAAEYIIHRYVFPGGLFFYPTHVQPATEPTVYIELGDGDSANADPDHDCPLAAPGWYNGTGLSLFPSCGTGWLEAYYVTARGATGGESQPSHIVFWDCGEDPGYARFYGPAIQNDESTAMATPLAPQLGSSERRGSLTQGTIAEADGLAVCEVGQDSQDRLGPWSQPLDWTPATAPLLTLAGDPPPFRIYDLHVDHLGSTRLVTDDQGEIVSEHKFLPFGEEILPTRDFSTKMFTGHERDRETGLDYMMARYYGASLARFFSTDPASESVFAGHPQTWNRYSYVFNNPIALIDPDGRVVVGARLETSGANRIAKPSVHRDLALGRKDFATLGPKSSPRGWAMAVNALFVTSSDDKASNYQVRQSAVTFVQDTKSSKWIAVPGGAQDSPKKKDQAASGRVLASFDAPGATLPPGTVPAGFTGALVQYTATQAVDAEGNVSGPTLYWKVTITVTQGQAQVTADTVDEEEYNTAKEKHDQSQERGTITDFDRPSGGGRL